MDTRLLRTLIYLFSGLIVVFSLLMLVNFFGSLAGRRLDLPGQEGPKAASAEAAAQEALAAARQGASPRASMIPSYRQGLSTAAVKTEGAIMLVKEKAFGGVVEEPKGMMEMLGELSGGDKNKPAPVSLKESDLGKKVSIGLDPGKEPSLAGSSMPELGRRPGQEGVTLLKAPVDYKLFKSSETWAAFTASRKCSANPEAAAGLKPVPSSFAAPDFSRDLVVVLVSVSELPNGIFKIVKVEKAAREVVISYRVDPLAMAAGAENSQHDFYSGAVIPGGLKVRLSQVP
ncbi:MAG: hypothetical protein NDI60_01520 [Elusimicrobiales bacterium]|nr:hypothetical protein [Elusimicrobiales bacterium]